MECLLVIVIAILAGVILYQKWTAYVIQERKEVNLEIRKARRKKRRSEFDVMLEKEIEKNESNVG